MHKFNIYCVITEYVSPWYNRDGWLGVKHLVTYMRAQWVCLRAETSII